MGRTPGLSKSRYQAGLQCPKHLWLRCHRPDVADAVSEAQQAVFDQGHRVGALARGRVPGGMLLTEDHLQGRRALEHTKALVNEGADCLYEAAFDFDGILVRTDILRKVGGGWELIEVKSSVETKDEHVTDAAVQVYTLEGAGFPVERVSVLHLDREYVYRGGPHDLDRLFALDDVTTLVRDYLPRVPGEVAAMKQMLAGECPQVRIGRRCRSPYPCGFLGHCHGFLPEFPVTEIPRIKPEILDALLAEGIYSIHDVPRLYPGLTPAQETVCEVVRSGEPRYGAGLAAALDRLTHPVHFLDFETYNPALPLYPGTRPYQVLPVQWSCHTLGVDGTLEHREFLHRAPSDPRVPFIESLLAAVPDRGLIVVYTAYEHTVLGDLARDLPGFAEAITSLQGRLFDLHQVIRDHVEHPGFHGRTSLKKVLPALVPDLSYEELAVQSGDVAMLRYQAAVHGDMPDEQREAVFADLLAYCGMDTLGLVRLLQELRDRC